MIRLVMALPLLVFGTIILSMLAARAIHPAPYEGDSFGMVWGICFAAVGLALHYGVGWLFNTESTPHGRRWHNRYLVNGLPVQHLGIAYAVIGWAIVCYNLGSATSAWVGWPVFLFTPVVVAGAVARVRRRQEQAGQ
jgi:hypothetical protein